ncbi:MAG: hypothetical protein ABI824_12585 [Acidobacteriota bacterium]
MANQLKGHPTLEELMAEQGTSPIDFSTLPKDPEPDDDWVDEFIATYREWRGHKRTDSAA